MSSKYLALAIDIGASSGRHIIGTSQNGRRKTIEVYRFDNQMDQFDGHFVWNIKRLWEEIKKGILIAYCKFPKISTIGIDTWGVDYVLLDDEQEIHPVYAYRDNRATEACAKVKDLISFEELYKKQVVSSSLLTPYFNCTLTK